MCPGPLIRGLFVGVSGKYNFKRRQRIYGSLLAPSALQTLTRHTRTTPGVHRYRNSSEKHVVETLFENTHRKRDSRPMSNMWQ
jgi:hypothetical protein